jgi:hypothetical protein
LQCLKYPFFLRGKNNALQAFIYKARRASKKVGVKFS